MLNSPEVIKVNDALRTNLVLAFAGRRAARAEMGEAQAVVERIIQKVDVDGELAAAIRRAGQLSQAFQQADAKLTAVITKVQAEAGMDVTGYAINPEDGTLVKPAHQAEPQPDPGAMVKARIVPMPPKTEMPKKAKKNKK